LKEVARGLGSEVVEWPLVEGEAGWRLDLERLESLLAGARLLVTNAPHNPTGFQPSQEEWRRIHELCARHGTRWFSDEMYRGLEHEPGHALAPAAVLEESAVSLWGMSKSFGLPGLRIGWLVSRDRELLARVEARKDYTSICSNAPGEFLARVALGAADAILRRNRARIAENERLLDGFVQRHSRNLTWLRPMAGPVSLVHLGAGSAQEYAERVRLEGGALLVPSTLFDLDDRHLRMGLGRASFPWALERWEAAGP
jgi:aspartate/methionine/tyrosine aminotransferase